MADVRDIVTDALREIGVLAAGETATADDANAGLTSLNRLVDQWAAERLQIHSVTRTLWTIASGTQSYTVGAGGTVNVARPMSILKVMYVDTTPAPDVEYPLTQFTDEGWARLGSKLMTSTLPTAYYYNPTFPLGTLSLWPVPTSSTLQGALYAPQAVAEFASLSTAISLPPGYRRMLVTNLALDLASSYGKQVDQGLAMKAQDSLAVVKRSNTRPMDMRSDFLSRPYYDINAG